MGFHYQEKRVLALESIQWTRPLTDEECVEQISAFITKNTWLSPDHFATVYLCHSGPVFTLIPDEFYSPGTEAEWLNLVAPLQEDEFQVMCNHHTQRGFHTAYTLPKVWELWARETYPGCQVQWLSEASVLAEAALSYSGESSFLIGLVDIDSVMLAGVKDRKLHFINRFSYQSENDLLYYFLMALDTCDFDPAQTPVLLAGSILSGSVGFEKLARYIQYLQWATPPEVRKPESLSLLDHHSWFDLLSLPLCINQLA